MLQCTPGCLGSPGREAGGPFPTMTHAEREQEADAEEKNRHSRVQAASRPACCCPRGEAEGSRASAGLSKLEEGKGNLDPALFVIF